MAQIDLDTSDEALREQLASRLPLGALCPDDPTSCNGQVTVGGRLLDCPHLDDCPHHDDRQLRRRQAALESMGFGVAYRHVRWSGIPPEAQRALCWYRDSIQERLRAGDGWGLVGKVGSGKTSALALTGVAASEAGADVQYASVSDILTRLHDGESPVYYVGSDLLLMDDLGAEYLDRRGYNLAQLQHIVDLRWERGRSICFTSNLSKDELRSLPALARTYDRLRSRCVMLGTRRGSQRGEATTDDWETDDGN